MSNYKKHILSEIHINNHIKPIRNIYLPTEKCNTLEFNSSNTVNTYTNLVPGLYKIIISSNIYYFILDESTEYKDVLYINNICNVYIMHNNIKKYIKLYMLSDYITTYESSYQIKNTVETFLDGIIVEGETIYSNKSIDSPSELQSLNTITISTSNDKDSDELKILLKNSIKRLPCGICDTFFMDSVYCNAFTIHNIGRTILSGSEPWEIIEKYCDSDYNVFFCNYDNIAIGNNKNYINCCSLESTVFNELTNYNGSCICIGNSNSTKGVYVKIQKQYAEDLLEFKGFLRKQIIDYKPFIVEYLLDKPIYKSVLLDEYHVKTFFKNTSIKINVDNATFLTRNFK